MSVAAIIDVFEAAGATFRVDGEKVRVRYPDEDRRRELAGQVSFLRDHRDEVAAFLRTRSTIRPVPSGVRLIEWNLKEPPIAIDVCSVVIDPASFAAATLEELGERMTNSRRKYGWSVPQLIDRLAQVGVIVALDSSVEQVRREAH